MKKIVVLLFWFLPLVLFSQTNIAKYYYISEVSKEDDDSMIGTIMVVFFVFIILIFTLGYATFILSNRSLYWFSRYTSTNKIKLHFILGLKMMSLDRSDLRKQVTFLFTYIQRRFPGYKGAVLRNKYQKFISYKVKEEKALKWLRKKGTAEDCIQVLDFLADLAYFNHRATKGELRFLYQAAKLLGVEVALVRSIISVREKNSRAYFEKEQKQQTASSNHFVPSKKQRIKQNLHILGLSHATHFDEVKKAYRKLAKTMHPDRFHNSDEAEQKMANERFTAINLAYEELEGLML